MTACKTTQKTRQWNLNQTVGWKSLNPNDYTVLFIRWNQTAADSTQKSQKKELDTAVLKELKSKRLGVEAENDEQTETDLHFLVSKDYKKAMTVILSVLKNLNIEEKVAVYKRDYVSFDKWEDKIVYHK